MLASWVEAEKDQSLLCGGTPFAVPTQIRPTPSSDTTARAFQNIQNAQRVVLIDVILDDREPFYLRCFLVGESHRWLADCLRVFQGPVLEIDCQSTTGRRCPLSPLHSKLSWDSYSLGIDHTVGCFLAGTVPTHTASSSSEQPTVCVTTQECEGSERQVIYRV